MTNRGITWDYLIENLCSKSIPKKSKREIMEDKLFRKLDSKNYLLMNTNQYHVYLNTTIQSNNKHIVPYEDRFKWLNMILIHHDAYMFYKGTHSKEFGSMNANILLDYDSDTNTLDEHLPITDCIDQLSITYDNNNYIESSGLNPFSDNNATIINLKDLKKGELATRLQNLNPGRYKKSAINAMKKNDIIKLINNT